MKKNWIRDFLKNLWTFFELTNLFWTRFFEKNYIQFLNLPSLFWIHGKIIFMNNYWIREHFSKFRKHTLISFKMKRKKGKGKGEQKKWKRKKEQKKAHRTGSAQQTSGGWRAVRFGTKRRRGRGIGGPLREEGRSSEHIRYNGFPRNHPHHHEMRKPRHRLPCDGLRLALSSDDGEWGGWRGGEAGAEDLGLPPESPLEERRGGRELT